MKKLLLLLTVLAFFVTGCKNNKTANTPNLNNREKDDYSKNNNLKNDNENKTDVNTGNNGNDSNNNNSMVSGWPQVERDAFKTNCEKNAIAGGTSSTVAQNYCACMLDKIENLYPNIQDANKLTDKDLETPEMKKMIKECLGEQ